MPVEVSKQTYKWTRFWCPRTGTMNLSDRGYLSDPESEFGHIYNPDLVAFDSIAATPCLALLGEPGIGKSHAMGAAQKAIDERIRKGRDKALWLDLRSFGSEDRLVRQLFESRVFQSWKKAKYCLHLFLDSLDECLLRIDTLSALLIDELSKYPVERLYLRVACRTADWPEGFEQGLRRLWGTDQVSVYELAVLRRKDVIEAAQGNNLDGGAFLSEIDRAEAVPLAIKPITLGFLLNRYRRIRSLPSTQLELYSEGCRLLCDETSESRRDAGLRGTFSAEQRMAVAARIAAVTVFTNRFAIWTGVEQGDVPDVDTTVRELSGGNESVGGNAFEVTEAAVTETLGTGLFSSRGSSRMGWAHQTYAEFLAAQYLVQHRMMRPQMMSLIVHASDPERRLVPQLHETAAWLSGMEPDVFREIMKRDPEVLLRSDVATADVRDRAALVEALLSLYEDEKSFGRGLEIPGGYRKLDHPHLAEQLRPYIGDRTKGRVVRRVAIEIAEASRLQAVEDELVEVALDLSASIGLRVEAASAVAMIGSREAKAKLKPLAEGKAGDDPEDRLKGWGLKAVWPDHMTAKELFPLLSPPKREGFVGAYQMFFTHDLLERLEPGDLPTALGWTENQGPMHKLSYQFKQLVQGILVKAWNHLNAPAFLGAYVKAVLARFRRHDEFWTESDDAPARRINLLSTDVSNRRRILEKALPMLSKSGEDPSLLVYSTTPLVPNDDVPWLIQRLERSKSGKLQAVLAKLIVKAFDWRDVMQLNAVLEACENSRILAEELAWLIKPVDLDSPQARRMKTNYLQRQKIDARNKGQPPLKPSPAKRIVSLLEAFESGKTEAWWRLNMEMTLERDSTHYGDELESDLTMLPGWRDADTATRARIIEAGRRYLLEQEPRIDQWLDKNIFGRPAFAGYRALRLLFQETPNLIFAIPEKIWKKWAPVTVAYPTSSADERREAQRRLVKLAYQYAPKETIETLIVLIDKENRDHGSIFVTGVIKDCWDARLADALLKKAKDPHLKPDSMGSLLGDLSDRGVNEAVSFLKSLIHLAVSPEEESRAKAVVAARILMTQAEDAGWPVVWPALQKHREFAHDVISTISHGPGRRETRIGERLSEDALADLYIWLEQHYPHKEDPKQDGGGWVSPRESIAGWRDSILRSLQERGTHDACEAIHRIIKQLPHLSWLKWMLQEAQNVTRRKTWKPPRPSDILRIARDQEARLVQSGVQLLDVLIESLCRLGEKLHGETPAVIDLWNEIREEKTARYRPKDENRLSDYVKRHLEETLKKRGVIVNREVEIRRGERTDIHVDAIVRRKNEEPYDSITAIIETKCCWNPELDTAMETQLVDRYLRENRCRNGLYLVGWFHCEKWDKGDYRKQQASKLRVEEAEKRFHTQAATLSHHGMAIRAFVLDTALR